VGLRIVDGAGFIEGLLAAGFIVGFRPDDSAGFIVGFREGLRGYGLIVGF
jgi:hypothetical protein